MCIMYAYVCFLLPVLRRNEVYGLKTTTRPKYLTADSAVTANMSHSESVVQQPYSSSSSSSSSCCREAASDKQYRIRSAVKLLCLQPTLQRTECLLCS